ncbi:hypothetical protein NC652_039508 [Populus alba x Populus x berolinensis]|uniref:Uncharacterized protein n=1 Tax=Populus alba x Populus x berolinensis TaxID=444605 RepID=A0AAD6LBC2_9ROSI|nr:hypothetical protein NC652_039508 [Populus alba x Populus x berolinensis]KAJ6957555.1 hypothetical protein NC653_039497 [Populus alba x Populus x berolinensis]
MPFPLRQHQKHNRAATCNRKSTPEKPEQVKRNLKAKKPIAAKSQPHTAEKTKRQGQACIPTARLGSRQQHL